MQSDVLNTAVLYGAETPGTWLRELVAGLPQVKLVGEVTGLEDCLNQHRKTPLDVVVVDLDHENAPPEWLGHLTQHLPHAAVVVCSHNQERPFLLRAMQLGVRELLGIPLAQSELEAAIERVRTAKRQRLSGEDHLGRMVAVAGLKGGVGATSLAVNLAVALAEKWPDRVALVDLGRPFADVAKFLDQGKKNNLLDLASHVSHLDPPFVTKTLQPHPTKVAVLQGCLEFKDWDLIEPGTLGKIWVVLRSMFDWIVVDLGHWPDAVYQHVVREADQVLLTTELMIPDLQNLKKRYALLRKWGLERKKIKVVINRYQKDFDLGLADLERILLQPAFFTLPADHQALCDAINHGTPLAEAAPRSKLWRSIQRLAEELAHQFQPDELQEAAAGGKPRRRFLFF